MIQCQINLTKNRSHHLCSVAQQLEVEVSSVVSQWELRLEDNSQVLQQVADSLELQHRIQPSQLTLGLDCRVVGSSALHPRESQRQPRPRSLEAEQHRHPHLHRWCHQLAVQVANYLEWPKTPRPESSEVFRHRLLLLHNRPCSVARLLLQLREDCLLQKLVVLIQVRNRPKRTARQPVEACLAARPANRGSIAQELSQ